MTADTAFRLSRAQTLDGEPLVPGRNVDRINIKAGMAELAACGYAGPRTRMVIEHALQRWSRGEEAAAERGAIDPAFHGIDFTSWRRVLAAAMAGAVPEARGGGAHPIFEHLFDGFRTVGMLPPKGRSS